MEPFDLNELRGFADKLHAYHSAEPDGHKQGRHVYTVSFDPAKGTVTAHVQYPMFFQLLEEHPNCPLEHHISSDGSMFCAHFDTRIGGVDLTTCMFEWDFVDYFVQRHGEDQRAYYKAKGGVILLEMFLEALGRRGATNG